MSVIHAFRPQAGEVVQLPSSQYIPFAPVTIPNTTTAITTLVPFLYNGTAKTGGALTGGFLYNYSSGVLGTLTVVICDITNTTIYMTGSYSGVVAGYQYLPLLPTVTPLPSAPCVLHVAYSTASWNHASDVVAGAIINFNQ